MRGRRSSRCCCGTAGEPCTKCFGDDGPPSFSISVSGFTNNSCSTCANIDGTYVVDYVSDSGGVCEWYGFYGGSGCGVVGSATVLIDKPTSQWRVRVFLSTIFVSYDFTSTFASIPNCMTFASEAIGPGIPGSHSRCNFPGSVLLTAL
jgi:hypothetical protein